YLTVKEGRFDLLQRTAELYNDAIDIFLLSLAQNENNKKAVAVILSGKGSDGRKGAEAIKKAGGLVIVQAPESCEFNSMPQQVIDSGYADFVLLPEDMAPVIQGYVNQAFSKNKADE
ncbi:MAG TPA: chemotaxis protein CheB, partial [Flavisolibacter sp.]|nr:chemotaxis protein CheB [Flavisolibacter sp.]